MISPWINRRRQAIELVVNLALLVGVLLVMAPFVWMVSASLQPDGAATTVPPVFFPTHPTLDQYRRLFERLDFLTHLGNSLLVASLVTIGSLVVNSMAAFAFAKYRFKGRDSLFALLLSLLIVPGQVTMFPVFLLMNKLHMINHFSGLIIPGLSSIFAIFLFRQFMTEIPDALIEAARLDGCSDFAIYWRIMMPLCKPILVTLALFTFMGTWNDFMWPLVVMTDSSGYTLPVALANLIGEHQGDTELMMAGAVLTTLPIMILFLLLQKYYIRGIMAGGVKG
ncbi:MAG: carbohydrate ABC transporter permease [Candidatus Sericytochromatia bacterium]|nr:carbohydrate ABC transporter permease [Candidatus Sericytochromatia bacterium]